MDNVSLPTSMRWNCCKKCEQWSMSKRQAVQHGMLTPAEMPEWSQARFLLWKAQTLQPLPSDTKTCILMFKDDISSLPPLPALCHLWAAPFAAIKGIRLLNDTWSNMLYTTGCINTYRRINCPRKITMIPKGKRTLIGTVINMAALGCWRK